jgi:hypothetical protein
MKRMVGSISPRSSNRQQKDTCIAFGRTDPVSCAFRKSRVHTASRCLQTRDILSIDTQTFVPFHHCAFMRVMAQLCKRSLLPARSCLHGTTFSFLNYSRSQRRWLSYACRDSEAKKFSTGSKVSGRDVYLRWSIGTASDKWLAGRHSVEPAIARRRLCCRQG